MTGIRESKKAATRRAMASAAAEIASSSGIEAMSVAAITHKAGVSQRTFHNYFPVKEDAVVEFVIECVDDLLTTVDATNNPTVIDLVEAAVLVHLDVPDEQLNSFYSLRALRKQFNLHARDRYVIKTKQLRQVVLERVAQLYPDLPPLAVHAQLAGAVAVANTALRYYFIYHHSDGPDKAKELVTEAFNQLRS
ncbi:MAG: TetR/AcrR family transcriptional regulator [Corynebacterium sp.]|uniref:TetR/AcrR family transcriptional regulator n=1 Tax=Corynebacterium sp. TaxID=1720 RepID=UPI0026DB8B2C|nr:TetR/AcrR family transcriptional regulator [Corynebacterium sp.]MDO4760963.1 TetR/AcrR family transcriptional regulator [Corynebacterium sp.]